MIGGAWPRAPPPLDLPLITVIHTYDTSNLTPLPTYRAVLIHFRVGMPLINAHENIAAYVIYCRQVDSLRYF